MSTILKSPYLIILTLPIMMMMSSSFYMLGLSSKLFSLVKSIGDPLNEAEQKRLDELLATGRTYHFMALVVSGILLALSTLDSFGEFLAPFGNISFPSVQTALGLYILVIVLLIATDYILLMAYPWLSLDERRPPFAWLILGLDFQRSYPISFWLYVPILIASIGMVGVLVKNASTTLSIGGAIISGMALVYFPRTIYYMAYFIEKREDHRGGSLTLSMYLLYLYRYFRQIVYTLLIAAPIIYLIPAWKDGYTIVLLIAGGVYIVVFVLRRVGSIKKVYRWIDRLGKHFGFPTESKNYR
jgi:hypothetical protein